MPVMIDNKPLPRNTMFYNLDPNIIEVEPGFNPATEDHEAEYQELLAFMKENGVPGALLVYKDGTRIVLVDGHSRLRAVKELNAQGYGITSVTVEFEKANQGAAERLLTALSRNKGKRYNPLEDAQTYRRFVAFRWTHQQIAQRVGMSISHVTQRLSLLEAAPELIDAIKAGDVTTTAAVEIIREARNGTVPQEKLLTQHKVAPASPATKEAQTLKAFTKSLDKIGIDEAIQVFLDYAKKEELEYLVEPFTLAIKAHERHTSPKAAAKRYIGDDDEE